MYKMKILLLLLNGLNKKYIIIDLPGCPSPTDSDVNIKDSISLSTCISPKPLTCKTFPFRTGEFILILIKLKCNEMNVYA